jgi:hypothetical protein
MVKSRFCFTFRNKTHYEIPGIGDKEVMFLWNRTCKGRKEGDLKSFGIWSVCVENSKYASEYPENVEVKSYRLM